MKISVKIPLAMAIITGASLFSLVVGFASFFYVKELMKEVVVQDSIVLTRETMDKIDQNIASKQGQIRQIATNYSIREYLAGNRSTELENIVRAGMVDSLSISSDWKEISVLDPAGNVLIATGEKIEPRPNQSDDLEGTYQKTLAQAISTRQSQVTEPYRLSESKEIEVTFLSPVMLDGNLIGVVEVRDNWVDTTSILSSITNLPLYLYNQQGYKIATNQSSSNDEVLNRDYSNEAFFHYVLAGKYKYQSIPEGEISVGGSNIRTVFAPQRGAGGYLGNGWVLMGEFSEKNAFASAGDSALKITALVIPLVIVVALLVLLIILRLIVRPISALTEGVEAIAKGDFSKRVSLNTDDELNQLADRFNEMTAKLESFYATLDKKVREKTAKLAEKTRETVQKNRDLEQAKVAMLNILEDVEEEKREIEEMARDLEKFKLAVEDASDHIVITDSEGVILFANRAAERITGYKFSEMRGNTPRLWGRQMDPDFYKNLWKVIKQDKKSFDGEFNNVRKNGDKYVAEFHISPVLDRKQDVRFFVAIERDITKLKEMDRAKTEFVSMASHQLRTPLTSIKWYIEMLQAGDAGKISKGQAEYLDEVHEANERMIGLVNDLLHVSRIDMDTIKITPKPANIRDIVESVVKEMRPLIERKKVVVNQSYAGDVEHVSGDPELIRVIFQNLISNAIKYNIEKGKVDIRVEKNQNGINITVKDTGYGIPEEAKAKIFTKLFRAENAKEKESEGSGLGMYIVKSIVEQSGGTVSFVSKENKGTTFTLKLPLSELAKDAMKKAEKNKS